MFNKKAYTAVFVKDSLNYYMLLDLNCKFQVIVLSSVSSRRGKKKNENVILTFKGFFCPFWILTVVVTSLFLCTENSSLFRVYKPSPKSTKVKCCLCILGLT